MTEARWDRIEFRVGGLETGLAEVRAGLDDVRSELAGVKAGLSEVRVELAEVKTGLNEVRGEVAELRGDMGDLRRHMGVLHEDVLDRISAIADPMPALERVLQRHFSEFRTEFVSRLEVLEAAERRRR